MSPEGESAANGGVRVGKAVAAALVAGVMAVVLASPAWAATLTVTTASDEQNTNGQCSLREAITNANQNDQSGSSDCLAGGGGDRIVFDLGDPPATITLASQLPPVTDVAGLTVDGSGSEITISGADQVRVFEVGDARLVLNGLTVADGDSVSGFGGGILNRGTLTVSNSTLSGNSASSGGGIANSGSATVRNSTLSGNSAGQLGGGIYNHSPGALLEVTNSTLSRNSASSGGGIEHADGSARLRNTIVAGSLSGGDCHRSVAPITDGGYNLSSDNTCGLATANRSRPGVDPMLAPLTDNGGPSPTHALPEDSPAVDKGRSFGATADQRGLPRPTDLGEIRNATGGDGSDIGAYEQVRCSGDVVNAAGTIVGDAGPNRLSGGPGDDFIFGLGGNDTITGGGGNDEVCSGKGNDRIEGEGGDDRLLGGEGRDNLRGDGGNDCLEGLLGDDRLHTKDGVPRNDQAIGGPGQDVYRTDSKAEKAKSCR